ncbi:MAG: hypothetical protein Q9201_006850 [Fulgogasparrea decipioides]
MVTLSSRQIFQPSCPQGGAWAACGFGSRFVGCCLDASAACVNGCSDEDLKPASFVKEHYLDITSSTCPEGSQWYTCATPDIPFMGCCTSNPCQLNGCPTNDLRAAYLSTDEAEAAPYSAVADPSAVRTPASSLSPTSASSPMEHTTTAASTAAPSSSSTAHTGTGAIVGGIVGSLTAIIVLAVLAFLVIRRRRQRRNPTAMTLPNNDEDMSAPPYQDSSTLATPIHELETPPPDPWHAPNEKAYEMPSPDLGAEKRTEGKEKDSKSGLRIYRPYRPMDKGGKGRRELYGEEGNVSYELDGRNVDQTRKP